MVDAGQSVSVLHRHAHPEVLRPIELVGYAAQAQAALGQHLVGVLWSVATDVEHVANEFNRHPGVEEVGHRVHEHHPGVAPPPRLVERLRMYRQPEAGARGARVSVHLILRRAHRLEPLGQCHRVAVVASVGDAIAAGDGVPGGLGPLDRRTVRHRGLLS